MRKHPSGCEWEFTSQTAKLSLMKTDAFFLSPEVLSAMQQQMTFGHRKTHCCPKVYDLKSIVHMRRIDMGNQGYKGE
jgi:hypothetical protein